MRSFIAARLFFAGLLLPVPLAAAEPSARWSYDDDYTGQEEWGALPDYKTCAIGTAQSPIVISYTKPDTAEPFSLAYSTATGTVKTTKQSFVFTVAKGGALTQGKNTYALKRIELHTPSEHMVGDMFYPLEIHLVHQNAQGEYFIVAVFAEVSAENAGIESLLNAPGNITLDTSALLPANRAYYGYHGSLTTPPCSENVEWRVLKNPISMSHAQLAKLGSIVGRNARLPQPLYMRTITETGK